MSSFFTPFYAEFGSTADIYASAASSGGTAGTPTLSKAGVRVIIVPSSDRGQWGAAPEGNGGERSEFWFMDVDGTAGLLPSYEVRQGTVAYICNGTADWKFGKVAGLTLPH